MTVVYVVLSFVGTVVLTVIIKKLIDYLIDTYALKSLKRWLIKYRIIRIRPTAVSKPTSQNTDVVLWVNKMAAGFVNDLPDDARFAGMLDTIYILLRLDQISESGGYAKSSVNTFYRLLGLEHEQISDLMKAEGGITCTCVTMEGLHEYAGTPWLEGQEFFRKVVHYLKERQVQQGGIGIKQVDRLTETKVFPTPRHTAQVTATLLHLDIDDTFEIVTKAAAYLHSTERSKLKEYLLEDSWPVAALAAYIKSQDQLLANSKRILAAGVSSGIVDSITRWRVDRSEWLHLLGTIGTTGNVTDIWYPEWPPPKKRESLWFQSFVTVLRQVPDIAKHSCGTHRTLGALRKVLARYDDGGICLGNSAVRDFSAMAAFWEVLMIPQIKEAEIQNGDNYDQYRYDIFNWLVDNYMNPDCYEYFWGELIAPFLRFSNLPDIREKIEPKGRLVRLEKTINAIEVGRIDAIPDEYSHVLQILESINANAFVKMGGM